MCGACRAAHYCCKEHQKQDWKVHKLVCKRAQKASAEVKELPTSSPRAHTEGNSCCKVVLIEVFSAEGLGLSNEMVTHVFASKADALEFVKEKFFFGMSSGVLLKPLKEMPFLTELLQWQNCELYVDPQRHQFFEPGTSFLRCCGGMPSGPRTRGDANTLNSLGIYIGCSLDTGLSMHLNARGTVFFIGQRNNHPVTANVLWGAAKFIAEAMEYYGSDDDASLARTVFLRWAKRYRAEKWEPRDGSAGVNLYETDPFQTGTPWHQRVHDHTRGVMDDRTLSFDSATAVYAKVPTTEDEREQAAEAAAENAEWQEHVESNPLPAETRGRSGAGSPTKT